MMADLFRDDKMSNTQIILDEVRSLTEKLETVKLTEVERATLDGLNGELDKLEEKNETITRQMMERQEKETELNDRLNDLEDQLMHSQEGKSKDWRNSDAYKAMVQGIRYGLDKIDPEYKELNLLRSDNDTSGGMVATETISNQILEPIIEISPFRQYCQTMTITTKSLTMPTYLGNMQCEWEGEAEQGIETTASFGTQSVTPFRLSTTVPVTIDMLMNASFDIEGYVMGKANQAFALKENAAFANGTGVKQPMGFLSAEELVNDARNTTSSNAIEGDDIMFLLGDLKAGYSEMLAMNRKTLAKLRVIKTAASGYLWQPGLNGGVANTIAGCPYFLARDMPDIATGAIPIALADWKRAYQIVDRTGVSFVRDEITQKRKAIVEITVHKWVTGAPLIFEAFKLLKVR